MAIARVFRSGNSQAVRLPKEFRIAAKEVEIARRGEEVVLRPRRRGMGRVFEILGRLPEDFFSDGRDDPPPQERHGL